jgi:pimeloyl-[acyl-carrier protein] methyl ester esterase
MKSALHVEKIGQGPSLVLIHGWGLNSEVWRQVNSTLAQHFTVYCVDLPGYGLSHDVNVASNIDAWATVVSEAVDEPAIWLGWSLGGLIATQIAVSFPNQVVGLITVASSPKFAQATDWPGIKPAVMAMFTQQLAHDFSITLERFLAIQAMGSESAKQDVKALKEALSQRPLPQKKALYDGLNLLNDVDLRHEISQVVQPFLRIYGWLDSLVPKKIISLVDDFSPKSEKYIFDKASHAPFVSHSQEFIDVIKRFAMEHS